MHCKACDKTLSDKEIQWNDDLNDWELCGTCLDAAMDAAYSKGYDEDDDKFILLDDDEPSYELSVYGTLADYIPMGYGHVDE